MLNENISKFETSIGLSRKWKAREAGREVAKEIIQKLNQPPSVVLLFSTIHYKKNGGFNELLKGIWEVLPDETPLIGGTVACFVNNYGCFSRGVTALAFSYPNMDVSIGIGKRTKIYPKNAAKICSGMIKQGLRDSNYKNKLLINMISMGKLPDLPYFGKIHIIKSKIVGWIASYIGLKLFPYFGYGFGKEEEVIDEIGSRIPEYNIIGGSSVDSNDILDNYQFIDKKVVTNSMVALGISIDLHIDMKTTLNLHKTNTKFNITKTSRDKRLIKKINNLPAKKQLLDLLKLDEEQFKEFGPFYYRVSNYLPFSFEENPKFTSGTGGFFGDNIYLGYKLRGKKVCLCSITGKEILDIIDHNFKNFEISNCPFVFMSSSSIFLNTLGSKSHDIKKRLDEYLKNIPYLMIGPITENYGTPEEKAIARVYSFNSMSLNIDN